MNSLKISITKIVQIICLFIVKYLYTYVTVITLDGLSYTGAIGGYYISYNPYKELVASVVMFIVAFYYSSIPTHFGLKSVVLHCMMFLYYIPINSAYAIHNLDASFLWLTTGHFFLIILLLTLPIEHKSIIDEKYEGHLYDNKIIGFCFIMCVCMILFKLLYNGFEFTISIDSESVYSNREEFNRSLSAVGGTVFSYLYVLFSNIGSSVAPFYLFISLKRKKIFPIAVSLLSILSEYALSSKKGELFGAVLVIGVYAAYRFGWLDHFDRFFNLLFVGIMSICFIERKFVRIGMIYFIFIRRVFQIPARLNFLYYEFFRINPKVMLTDSVLGLQRLLPHVYSVSPMNLISDEYFQGTMSSANTGLFGAAYMQLGIMGIILQPLLIYLLVHWAEEMIKGYGKGIVAVIGITMVMKMQSIPLLRTDFILSEILFIALIGLLPRVKEGKFKFIRRVRFIWH